ncbi:TetR/AcrR family transcriptional regulator [Novosphingobium sp. YAF33]
MVAGAELRIRATRQERSLHTRHQALAAVEQLLGSIPLQQLTFAQVSAASGISVGAITFRFGNRANLIGFALTSLEEKTTRQIARIFDAIKECGPLEKALEGALADVSAVFANYRVLFNDEASAHLRASVLDAAAKGLETLLVQRCLSPPNYLGRRYMNLLSHILIEALAARPDRKDLSDLVAICSLCLRNSSDA